MALHRIGPVIDAGDRRGFLRDSQAEYKTREGLPSSMPRSAPSLTASRPSRAKVGVLPHTYSGFAPPRSRPRRFRILSTQ